MAIQKIVLTFIFFILAFCVLDAIATEMTSVEEGESATLFNTVGWIIWDILAVIMNIIALPFHAIASLGGVGDPMGCIMGAIHSANSLVYHLLYFITEVAFGPAEMASTLAVNIFNELGWSTSIKTVTYWVERPMLDSNGEPAIDQEGEVIFERVELSKEVEYIGIGNIPVLGDALKLLGDLNNWLLSFVTTVLGNPDTHRGGIYDVINASAKDPLTNISWGIPSWFKNDVLYPSLDIILNPLIDGVQTINSAWEWMLRIDIFSMAGLKNAVYKGISFILDLLPHPIDTRASFWAVFGMDAPEITHYIGGDLIEIPTAYEEEGSVWEAPLIKDITDALRGFLDGFQDGSLSEEFPGG